MGWLIVLGILVLLAITPVGVLAGYNSDGVQLRIVAGPVRITVLPAKKKDKKPKEKRPKPKKEKPPKSEKKSGKQEKQKKTEKGGSVLDFLPLLQIVFDFLGEFRRKLRVDRLEMKLILGGGDPATLGINYGKAWAAVGNLMPQLERFFVIKKRDVEVECDFTAAQTLIIARLQITITIGRILSMVVRYAIRALLEYLKIENKRKGGNAK
jgi:hypothetical protein